MVVVTAMRLVADAASLPEDRLMMHRFLLQIGDFAVAIETDGYAGALRQAGLAAGMRAVTVGAFAGSAGMLNFCGFNLLGFVIVASDTEGFRVALGEDNFAVFRGSVADVALLIGEGRMGKLRHQLGSGGLMRIVASDAIGLFEWLILVRLLQIGIAGIVAIETKRRRPFGQMKIVFQFAQLAGFVGGMAGIATHIESGVAAALGWYVLAGIMASEAEILFGIAGNWFEQLILVIGNVGVVALEAIAHRGRVNRTFNIGRFFVGVAGQAESHGSGGDELDVSDVAIDANFVATGAAHSHSGVHGFALGFVLVAGDAGGRIGFGIKRNRMLHGECIST